MRRLLIFCLVGLLGAGVTRAETPPQQRVVMRSAGKNRDVPDRADGNIFLQSKIFVVGEQRVSTVAEFKKRVLMLPPGTEIYWHSGCIKYRDLPVVGPPATIDELQRFCAEHGVKFTHTFGY